MASNWKPKEYVYVSGKLFWCRCKTPESWGDERYWSVTVYPDANGIKVVRELKEVPAIMNRLKKDDDGEFIKFKRPCQRQIRGQWIAFDPPIVLNKDGQPIDDSVGNGSDGIVKLEVYKWDKPTHGRAARLESIRVDNLIPYEAKRDFDVKQEKQVRGLDQIPGMPSF